MDKVKEILAEDIMEEEFMNESTILSDDAIANIYINKEFDEELLDDKEGRITLQEIVDKTENFTIFEKKPGFLYRLYEPNIDDRSLNSDLICRIRWLIKDFSYDLPYLSEEKIYSTLADAIETAYEEQGIEITDEQPYDIKMIYKNIKKQISIYRISLETGPIMEYVLFDIVIEHSNDVELK